MDFRNSCHFRRYKAFYDPRAGERMRIEVKEKYISDEIDPFAIIYEYENPKTYTTFVELSYKPLIDKLIEILPDNNDLICPTPKVKAQALFHVLDKLHDDAESEPDESSGTKQLIQFLKQEYEQEIRARNYMIARRVVSFDMLWIFFPPNQFVWYRCNLSGQQLGGEVSEIHETRDYRNNPEGKRVIDISIKMIDCDGKGFKYGNVKRRIEYFEGEKKFSELDVVPFVYTESQDFLRRDFAKRGKKFFDLAKGRHYKGYKGPLLRWKEVNNCVRLEKIRADGRIMIDAESFAIMNPDYQYMGNATPPSECDIQLLIARNVYLDDESISKEKNHIFAPATVYGFSFALKEWGCFDVSKINDVFFNLHDLDKLVINQEYKDLLLGLVKEHNDLLFKSPDHIAGKGNGCIILCYGAPGTGKTFTAESVAESLKRPLWVLGMHELGTEPDEVEKKLIMIQYVAHEWKAILLLKKADIYLERCSTNDLKRNAMVSIFLRFFECYQGMLFLTTNRITSFSDEIFSHVNIFFHYPFLDQKSKSMLWTKWSRDS
ncbi:P-loop containing nucleoside triphosphate hydrolase protein [Gigaspora margarita]|uniref:P-loop containing nucleoside triphosphate hydrolase protein n=1 Tax=Gigaspora margarita TaxID=4874 RepID=A0A8H4AE52_GIGMA|nr:P-loop containing nucleoside triphosphate hydrolase protein [Gigaspora margarita]